MTPLSRRAAHGGASVAGAEEVVIRSGGATLGGTLALPPGARALVVFAHGSGSSRFSPRNNYVAGLLREAGLGTLLFDLLTRDEERVDAQTREFRFDIRRLADRVRSATDWLAVQPATRDLAVGYFGASTGAAAALVAGAELSAPPFAIVSRGGRPDLAGALLPAVKSPTLLIVGGNDPEVLALNRQALAALTCARQLVVIPGATHLFEEPGTLDQATRAARDWFLRHQ